jgi:hypothetical protein
VSAGVGIAVILVVGFGLIAAMILWPPPDDEEDYE